MHKRKTERVEKLGKEALWVSMVWFDSTFSFAVCGFVALVLWSLDNVLQLS